MHICFICSEYPPERHGGIGSFNQTLGRALVARGHQVTVIGFYRPDRAGIEDDEGVRVIRLPHASIPFTGLIVHRRRLRKELLRLHHQTPIDILEGQEAIHSLVSRSLSLTKVIRMHGGHRYFHVTLGKKPRLWRSWLESTSFARANYICAVSRFVAETTRDLLQLNGRPIEIIPNPVNTDLFCPRDPEGEEDGLILYVGTVCEKKGVRQLVQAMPQVIRNAPHARLWIVGHDSKEPDTGQSFTDQLRGLIPPEFKDHIIFKGPVEHSRLPEVIAKARICVYPSHMEAMPIAWLEGLAMGKAIVASRTGPGPEVIEDGATGLLCDPHEPSSIAEKLLKLLNDPSLGRRMGEQAHKRALAQFSINALIERNEAFYQRCIESARGA